MFGLLCTLLLAVLGAAGAVALVAALVLWRVAWRNTHLRVDPSPRGHAWRVLRHALAPNSRELRTRKLRGHPAHARPGLTQQEFADRLGTTARTVAL